VVPRSILLVLNSPTSQILKTSTADSLLKIEIFHQNSYQLSTKTRPQSCAHHQVDGVEETQSKFKLLSMGRITQRTTLHSTTITSSELSQEVAQLMEMVAQLELKVQASKTTLRSIVH
jgi:hypothetical protein